MKKAVNMPVALALVAAALIFIGFLWYRGLKGPEPPPLVAPMGDPAAGHVPTPASR